MMLIVIVNFLLGIVQQINDTSKLQSNSVNQIYLIINILWTVLLFILMIRIIRSRRLFNKNVKNEDNSNKFSEPDELKTIIYSIGDALITTDTAGKIVRMNIIAEQLTGLKESDVKGIDSKQLFSIISEDENLKYENPVDRVLKSKQKIELSNSALLKLNNGKTIPISDSASPIINDKGEMIGVVLIFRDETENRRKKKLLQESENKFSTIFQSSPEGIAITSLDGMFIDVNQSFVDMTGYNRQEIIGKTTIDLNFWINAEERKDFLNQISTEKKRHSVEAEFRIKSGETRYAYLSSELIELGKEKVLLTIIQDITERKKAEQELKLMSTAINKVKEAAYLMDFETNFKYVNEEACRALGYTRDEFLQMSVKDIDTNYDLKTRIFDLDVIKNNQAVKIETCHRTKSGTFFPVEISSTFFEYNGENFVLSLAKDISERKTNELLLLERSKHSQSLLRLSKKLEQATSYDEILDAAFTSVNEIIGYRNLWVYLLDDDLEHCKVLVAKGSVSGKIQSFANVANLTIKGDKMLEEIVSQKDIVVVEDARTDERTNKEIVAQIENRTIVNIPIILLDRHLGSVGTGTFGDEGVNPPTEAEQEFLMALASHLAVSLDRVHLQILKKEAEERIRKLSAGIEQSPASVVITDIEGNVEYVNKRFTEITGYTFEEIKGQSTRLLKSGETPPEEYKTLWQTITNKNEWRGEFHNKKKNGELYWELASISPILNERGETTNFIAVKEDITAIKKMTAELIAARNKAEEMNKVKSYFYAQMSHELRTPFVGIFGFAELLKEKLNDSEEKEMANAIFKSSKRLMDTLNKILDITKLEFDKLEPKYDSVDLKQLITELRDNFLVTAQNQNTFISTSFNTETLAVKSDEKLLTEILNNLINNAVKYTINGLIEIKTEVILSEQHNLCIIKVIDNGIGIPEEKISLIWDEFRQASEGFNRTFEGTGLGLSITKKYVELLGGKISVESKVDKGTVFTIELPYVAADNLKDIAGPDVETIPVKKSKGGIKPKILYVEDEGITLLYVQKILSDYYDVDTADNSTTALEKISKNYYAALLLDINLKKGIDGVKLMEIIRGNSFYKTIPIAAITAFASTNDKIEFLNRGFSHYLPKPFNSDDIYKLLDSMFNKH